MNSIRNILALLLLGLLPLLASAETRFGKYAGEFMAIGVGGRPLGMGSAYVALAGDVTAGYWNPAGLARIMYPEVSLMHDERYGSLVNYDYGAVAIPFGANDTIPGAEGETPSIRYNAGSFALSVMRLGIDGIPDTRNAWPDSTGNGILDQNERPDYSRITFFNDAEWAVYLTYARQGSANLFYGASVKFIRRDLAEFHGTGIGFDAGIQYTPFENFFLGANAQDITTTLVAWNTGTNELISPTLKIGAAYAFDFLGGQFTPAADADLRFENREFASNAHLGPVSADVHAGLEYDYRRIFALRAGYNELGNLTLGAGIHLRKLDIDYSFVKFNAVDQLGNTHRISLRFVLQEDRFRRGAP